MNGRAGGIAVVTTAALTLGLIGAAGAAAKPKANLSVAEVSSPPALSVATGDGFKVSGKVANKGKAAAKATVRVELRRAGQVRKIAQRKLGKVKPKSKKKFNLQAAIPGAYPPSSPDPTVAVCVRKRGSSGKFKCRKAGRVVVAGPGGRTLDDPYFPQIGNTGYAAAHYAIDLDYDPDANVFNPGTMTAITAEATQNLSELSFDFQDLDVSEVTVNGVSANFEQVDAEPPLSANPDVTQPMKLVVTPTRATRPLEGEDFVVAVAYAGAPEQVTDPDTSWEGWIPACFPLDPPQTCDGAFVVNEPIGAQSWFPSNNYPTEKATFDTAITVPDDTVAFGVGELDELVDHGDGTATWRWTEDDPTAPYLTTGTVGDFDLDETVIDETSTGVTLPTYNAIDSTATPEQVEAINMSLDRAGEQLNFLGDFLGPYPFDSMGAVADKAAGVGYALEVQTKPHYAGSFTTGNPSININTQLHEIAHQWVGNSVSPATWREIWFNEGWATWLTWLWAFEEDGAASSPADQFDDNYTPGTKWDVPPADLGTPENLFSGFPVYTRPAMMIEGYRQIVGDETFFDFAAELVDGYAYGNISGDEFVDLALEMSGFAGDELALLEEYFAEWLFLAGMPEITPDDFVPPP